MMREKCFRLIRVVIWICLALATSGVRRANAQESDQELFQKVVDRFASQISEAEYLSAKDAGYTAIEDLQRAECAATKSRFCTELQRDCVAKVLVLWVENFQQLAPIEGIRMTCQRVSTRYETPGVYGLLNGILKDVQAAANSLKLPPQEGIRIGSLTVNNVNARVQPKNRLDVQIVLVNNGFFQFANELTKVVAKALPVSTEGDKYVLNRDLESLDAALDKEPALVDSFEGLLKEFLGKGPRGNSGSPTAFSRPIQIAYTHGMETFAVAHEVAHAIYGHTGGRAFDAQDLKAMPERKDLVVVESGWAEEIEADIAGARLAAQVFREDAKKPDQNMFFVAAPFAVEYYFVMREIMQAGDVKWFVAARATASPQEEGKAFERLLPCIDRPGCRVRGFLEKEAPELLALRAHPSYQLRRQVVRHVLDLEKMEKSSDDMFAIATFLRESALRIWARVDARKRGNSQ